MRLMHELKQLVHNRLQELPMRLQESRVLPDDIHNVRRDNRLVVFPALHLAQPEQVFNHCYEESLFGLLV